MTVSEVKIELYEEVIGDLNYSTPPRSRSASPAICEQETLDSPPFNGPYNLQEQIQCPHSSQSDLRYLAGNPNGQRAVVEATLQLEYHQHCFIPAQVFVQY